MHCYELGASSSNEDDPIIKHCLFGAVTLTKNTDIDKYGYGIGFDRISAFSFPGGGFGQNVIIFGVDMRSSAHIDNKKKDILVLGKGSTQGLLVMFMILVWIIFLLLLMILKTFISIW